MWSTYDVFLESVDEFKNPKMWLFTVMKAIAEKRFPVVLFVAQRSFYFWGWDFTL